MINILILNQTILTLPYTNISRLELIRQHCFPMLKSESIIASSQLKALPVHWILCYEVPVSRTKRT